MTKNPFQKFIAMLSEDRRDIMYLYAYSLFYAIVNLSLPLGVQAIIGLIQAGTVSTSWIILSAVVTAGVLIGGVLQVLQLSISEILQQRIFTRAAFEFTYRIPRFQNASIRGQYPPELINRFFDTLNVQKGLSKILMDFSASSLQILIGLILLSTYHPFFITFGVALIIVLVAILYYTWNQTYVPVGFPLFLDHTHAHFTANFAFFQSQFFTAWVEGGADEGHWYGLTGGDVRSATNDLKGFTFAHIYGGDA